MKKETRDNIMGVIMLALFLSAFLFIWISTGNADSQAQQRCMNNCKKYNMPFLESAHSTYSSSCFCLDSDGKPRAINSEES